MNQSDVHNIDEETFNSSKRVIIDNYFRDLINKIDVKTELSLNSIQKNQTQIDELNRLRAILINEIELIRHFNLDTFDATSKDLYTKFVGSKGSIGEDELNKLIFKKFCFLIDWNQSYGDINEDLNRLGTKLVIIDWYLDEKQLYSLK